MTDIGYVIDVTKRNRADYLYLSGDKDTDGSKRFCIDADTGFSEIQLRTEGVWLPASFEVGTNSLWVGCNVGVAGVGHHLATESSEGHLHFHAHSEFVNNLSTTDAQILYAYADHIRTIFQPDESGEFIGTSTEFSFPSTSHLLARNIYYKVGSVAATAPIRIRIYQGSDDTGPLVFDQTYPASLFVADTEIEAPYNGCVEFDEGQTYFLRYTSEEDFSFKSDVTNVMPWFAADYCDVREENLLQTKPWVSGEDWDENDYCIKDRLIHICNEDGVQTGTWEDNAAKWSTLGMEHTQYWQRNGTTLSPANAGDTISADNLSVTNGGITIDRASNDSYIAFFNAGAGQGQIRAASDMIKITNPLASMTHFAVDTGSGEVFCYDDLLVSKSLYVDNTLIVNSSGVLQESDPVFLSQKGANSGVATLDAGGKIPSAQLPNSVMDYKGTWNASTNTPTLADGTGNAGDVYICDTAGTQDLGSGDITFAEGDWIIYNGSTWEKSINSDRITSVNGQTGVVVLNLDDIGDGVTYGRPTFTKMGQWDTAYGWGDHASEGYLKTETDPVFTAWDKSTGISITESQISDLNHFNGLAGNLSGITQNRVPFGNASGGLIDSPNLMYSDSALRVNNGGIYLDRTGADSYLAFKRDGVQVGQIRGADGSIDITESGGSPVHLSVDTTTGITTMTGVDTSNIGNSGGILKLNPDAAGIVELFGDADVLDDENGKMLYVWRRAPEADDYIRFYISSTRNAYIHSGRNLTLQGQIDFTINSVTEDIIFKVGDNAGAKKVYFKDSDGTVVANIDSNGNAQFDDTIEKGGALYNNKKTFQFDPNTIPNTYTQYLGTFDMNSGVVSIDIVDSPGSWHGNVSHLEVTKIYSGSLPATTSIQLRGGSKGYKLHSRVIDSDTYELFFEDLQTIGGTVDYEVCITCQGAIASDTISASNDTDIEENRLGLCITDDGDISVGKTSSTGYAFEVEGVIAAWNGSFVLGSYGGVWDASGLNINGDGSSAKEALEVNGNAIITGLINDGVKKYSDGTTQQSNHNLWDCRTADYIQEFLVGTWGTGPHQILFDHSGTRMYVLDNTSEEINEFTLTTPWDVSTAGYSTVHNLSSQAGNPMGMCFNLDGTKLYVCDSSSDSVYQYTLSSAWDLSTLAYASIYKDVSAYCGSPVSIMFKPDGLRCYINDGSSDEVEQWDLTTAWDISTASYSLQFDSQMDNIEGGAFSPDGARLYVVDGSAEDDIHEYHLSVPWDISTAVYKYSKDLTGIASVPNSIFFRPDGTKMYITENNAGNDSVMEFDLGPMGNVSFYGGAPVELQTGVAVTAASIHAALVNLGLITA